MISDKEYIRRMYILEHFHEPVGKGTYIDPKQYKDMSQLKKVFGIDSFCYGYITYSSNDYLLKDGFIYQKKILGSLEPDNVARAKMLRWERFRRNMFWEKSVYCNSLSNSYGPNKEESNKQEWKTSFVLRYTDFTFENYYKKLSLTYNKSENNKDCKIFIKERNKYKRVTIN